MPYTFFVLTYFYFSMANQSFLKVNCTTGNHCTLCIQVVKHDEKWKDITEEGIYALKELDRRRSYGRII